MIPRSFWKMHGLGNDFVIIDVRDDDAFKPSVKFLLALADRHRGIGYDQIIFLHKPKLLDTDVYLDMYNSDGSPQYACGNVTRCVARLMFDETGKDRVVVHTVGGKLICEKAPNNMVSVNFGAPRLEWHEVPLARACDTLHVPLSEGDLSDACCLSMGNPHAVFFVSDVADIPLSEVGPVLEHKPLFPDRSNIEVVQVMDRAHIRMRVWERGAGITLACGTGACATLVASIRRGLADRKAKIMMDGGDVWVEWRASDNHVILTGPTAHAFTGVIADELLGVC